MRLPRKDVRSQGLAPAGPGHNEGSGPRAEASAGEAGEADLAGGGAASSFGRLVTYAVLAGACLTSFGLATGLALASPRGGELRLGGGLRPLRRSGSRPGERVRTEMKMRVLVAAPPLPARMTTQEAQAQLVSETAAFRGQKYYISNNHTFTGPWTEERFFDHWSAARPQLERLYIPIGWTGSELVNHEAWKRTNNWALSHILSDLDRSVGYFTVIQIAKGFENDYKVRVDIPGDLDLTVFATGPTTATHIVPLPLLKEEMQPANLTKDIKVSFTGTFGAHPSRQAAREMYQDREGWVFEEPHAGWAETAERSRFVLCPRGWGVSSFRLYESLQLGAIPIYVHDDDGPWLPYVDLVDWQTFSLTIHERDLAQLGDVIDLIEASGTASIMLGKVAKVRHMWGYDFMNGYIVDRLRAGA